MRTLFTPLALSMATVLALPALAQTQEEVRFQAGDFGTNVGGSITGQGYQDYLLGANAGQEMFAEMTVTGSTGNGTAYFNILPPGSNGVAIYNGSMDGNTTTVELPKSGEYTIRIYHMGNDADSGATTDYRLDLSIQ